MKENSAKKRFFTRTKTILALVLILVCAFAAWPLFYSPGVVADPGNPQFAVLKSPSYIDLTKNYVVYSNVPGEFQTARFIIRDEAGSNDYIAFCADYLLTAPEPGKGDTHAKIPEPVSYAAALAAAISHPSYGAKLSLPEFNALFGVNLTEHERYLVMSCFIWADREGDVSSNPDDWDDEIATLRTALKDPNKLHNPSDYQKVAEGLRNMITAYSTSANGGGISGISSDYNTSTGEFTFNPTGYVAATSEYKLTVTGSTAVFVNGTKYSGAVTDLTVLPGQAIYIYGANVNITVAQTSPLTLGNGSIKGDLLENQDKAKQNDYQHLLVGYAEFGAVSSNFTGKGASPVSVTVDLKKAYDIQQGQNPAATKFTFTVEGIHTVYSATKEVNYPSETGFSFTDDGLAPGAYVYKITEWLTFDQSNAGWGIIGGNVIWARVIVAVNGTFTVSYGKNANMPSDSWSVDDSTRTFNNQFRAPVHKETITYFRNVGKTITGAFHGIEIFELRMTRVNGNALNATPTTGADADSYTRNITISSNGTGSASASIDFPDLTLEVGTYYYKIEEIPPGTPKSGWIYDKTFYIATVVVSTTGQNITLTMYQNGEGQGVIVQAITFANHYVRADFSFEIQKSVTGAFSGTSPVFTFKVREVDSGGQTLRDIFTHPMSNVSVGFPGSVTFAFANVSNGIYYYVVEEVVGSEANWQYDSKKMIVRAEVKTGGAVAGTNEWYRIVTVDYPCDGTLAPFWNATEYKSPNEGIIFNNIYTSAATKIQITKTVTGRTHSGFPSSKQFTFVAEEVDGNGGAVSTPSGFLPGGGISCEVSSWAQSIYPDPWNDTMHVFVDIGLNGLKEGTYYFKITEKDESVAGDGWTYDKEVLYMKLEVTKNAGGTLEATTSAVDINGSKSTAVFTNSYYKGSASLSFTKAYAPNDGNYYLPNSKFEYILSLLSGDGDNPTRMTATANTARMEFVDRGVKTFSGVGLLGGLGPGTYYFSIVEAPNAQAGTALWNGWTHGTEELYAKVTMGTQAGETTVEWWNGTAWIDNSSPGDAFRTITNGYSAASKTHGVINIGGMKTLEILGSNPTTHQFSFVLTELNSTNPVDEKTVGGIQRTAHTFGSVSGAPFSFPSIQLAVNSDVKATKDYYFKIVENFSGIHDWTSDPVLYVVTVRVWGDPGHAEVVEIIKYVNGKISGTTKYGPKAYPGEPTFTHDAIKFDNVFPGDPPTGKVTVEKKFDPADGAPTDNTEFVVLLTRGDGKEYTFTLNRANNWKAAIVGIEPGEYQVSEIGMPILYDAPNGGQGSYRFESSSHDKITVTDGLDLTVTVTNKKYPPPPPPIGKVTVKKAFADPGDTPTDATEFTVVLKQGGSIKYKFALNAQNNWEMELANVLPGTYEVEETNMPRGYEKVSLSQTQIAVTDQSDIVVTLTNKRTAGPLPPTPPGKITVEKKFDPVANTPPASAGLQFVVVLKQGTDVKYTFFLSALNNWKATLDVDPGDYTVEELNMPVLYDLGAAGVASYKLKAISPDQIKVEDGVNRTITVTNEWVPPPPPPVGKVTAKKAFEPADGAPTDGTAFTVVLSQGGSAKYLFTLNALNNWTMELPGVVPGTYDVEEINIPAGYEKVSLSHTTITVADKSETTITATNKKTTTPYNPPPQVTPASLTIGGTKSVNAGAPDATFTFTLTQVADAAGTALSENPFTRTKSVSGVTASRTFEFDPIPFSLPGVYYFKIQETAGGVSGWAYDTAVRIVTVTVTERAWSLAAEYAYTTGSPVFANSYDQPPPPTTTTEARTRETVTSGSSEDGFGGGDEEDNSESSENVTSRERQVEDKEDKDDKEEGLVEPVSTEFPTEPAIEPRWEPEEEWIGGWEEDKGGEEEFESVDGKVPVGNGWWAQYDPERDVWLIYDENGTPIGFIILPDGVDIEDYDVVAHLIPFGGLRSLPAHGGPSLTASATNPTIIEPIPDPISEPLPRAARDTKPNPETGDGLLAVLLGLMAATALGGVGASVWKRKTRN